MTRRLFGIGNPDRGDDAAGIAVAEVVVGWETEVRNTGSPDMIESWFPSDEVVIVDAMSSGASPGLIRKFDGRRDVIPSGAFTSTHSFGPAEIVALAGVLDRMPSTLTLYGIEIGHTEFGEPMSAAVQSAVTALAEELRRA
jgi:hydrogenase maturation protease